LRAPRFPVDWDGFYSPQLYRSVELHIRLWEAEREKIRIEVPEDPLDRIRVHEWQGLRFQTLDGVDALVYQALHALRHILNNWCRLSILFEIANFLDQRAGDTAFWEEFNKRIRRRRLLPEAAGVVFAVAARLFSVPIPGRAAAFPIPTAVLSAWVERYGLSSALENFSGNKFSLFLHREFVESDAGWREVRRRRLFPMQSPLHAAKVLTQRASSRTAARWRQCKHAARRFRYHLISALLYALHWPLWRRTRKRLSEEGLWRRPSGVAGAAGSVRTVVESFD
ncbi:MAG: nucleotidyltransferase family protein, partial [Acidobacteria bacterium]|nr:nucleotidyltransferase family protein [Acidobacteriota bacterium]